jgi:hypothetical protein
VGAFDSETIRVMGVAFEATRYALDGCGVASQKMHLAQTGERNPDFLCERALKLLRPTPARVRDRTANDASS